MLIQRLINRNLHDTHNFFFETSVQPIWSVCHVAKLNEFISNNVCLCVQSHMSDLGRRHCHAQCFDKFSGKSEVGSSLGMCSLASGIASGAQAPVGTPGDIG